MTHPRMRLEQMGLNLMAEFEIETLAPELKKALTKSCSRPDQYNAAILLAAYGPAYWHHLNPMPDGEQHPVDQFVIRQVEDAFSVFPHRILYPGDHFLPLAELGELAGWHHQSPLGLGIHPDHGLWYAYRAVILVAGFDVETTSSEKPQPHPCEYCVDRPCIGSCPAAAVRSDRFDVNACSEFRLQEDSPCSVQCLSRLSCPVGQTSRYGREQMAYHYRFSLAAIRRYISLAVSDK